MTPVFVYGTLLSGRYNHDYFLKGVEFMGEATLQGYALYNLGSYPGIIPASGERVMGEVYQVDDQILARLDRLEGNGWLYTRQVVGARVGEKDISVQVYIWNGEVHPGNKVGLDRQPWNDEKMMRRNT